MKDITDSISYSKTLYGATKVAMEGAKILSTLIPGAIDVATYAYGRNADAYNAQMEKNYRTLDVFLRKNKHRRDSNKMYLAYEKVYRKKGSRGAWVNSNKIKVGLRRLKL